MSVLWAGWNESMLIMFVVSSTCIEYMYGYIYICIHNYTMIRSFTYLLNNLGNGLGYLWHHQNIRLMVDYPMNMLNPWWVCLNPWCSQEASSTTSCLTRRPTEWPMFLQRWMIRCIPETGDVEIVEIHGIHIGWLLNRISMYIYICIFNCNIQTYTYIYIYIIVIFKHINRYIIFISYTCCSRLVVGYHKVGSTREKIKHQDMRFSKI